jgi:hypothetical protein
MAGPRARLSRFSLLGTIGFEIRVDLLADIPIKKRDAHKSDNLLR